MKTSGEGAGHPAWEFVLYIGGENETCQRAESMIRRLCDHYLADRYTLTIIDVTDPSALVPPDVLAVPTTIRVFPRPERRVIGDLSDVKKAARGFGLLDDPLL
jgi:circadian clock protein KaiB